MKNKSINLKMKCICRVVNPGNYNRWHGEKCKHRS